MQVIVLNLAPERLVCPIGTSWHICNEDGASLQTWPSRKTSSPRVRGQAGRQIHGEMVGVRHIFSGSDHPIRRPFLRGKCNTRSGRHRPFHPSRNAIETTEQDPNTLRTTHAKNNAKRCQKKSIPFQNHTQLQPCRAQSRMMIVDGRSCEPAVSTRLKLQQQDNEIGREMKRIRNHLEFGEAG